MFKIAVIDGQGGGFGRRIIEQIRREIPWDIRVIALGTNSQAMAAMLKGGANVGAMGENSIVNASLSVDLVLGPLSIIAAGAMDGEITESIALAVAESPAHKFLIPFNKGNIEILGVSENLSPSDMIESAVRMTKACYYKNKMYGKMSEQ